MLADRSPTAWWLDDRPSFSGPCGSHTEVQVRIPTLLCTMLAVGAVTTYAGQAQATEPGSSVVLNVIVLDKTGEPIAGLASGDFLVSVDGVERPVTSVQFFGTTTGQVGAPARSVVLAIDLGSIRAGSGQAMLESVSAFVDSLAPTDRVGLVTFPGGGPVVDLTTDRASIKDAVGRIVGNRHPVPSTYSLGLVEALYYFDRDPRWESVVRRECDERYRDPFMNEHCRSGMEQDAEVMMAAVTESTTYTVAALRRVLLQLSPIEGVKTVLLVSEGIVTGSAQRPASVVDPSVVRTAAARAGAGLYVFQVQARMLEMGRSRISQTVAEDEALRRQGLDALAAQVGGVVIPLRNDGDAAFRAVARELSAVYLLGVAPTATDRDGQPHTVRVEVKRPGAVVRLTSTRLRATPAGTQ